MGLSDGPSYCITKLKTIFQKKNQIFIFLNHTRIIYKANKQSGELKFYILSEENSQREYRRIPNLIISFTIIKIIMFVFYII